MKTKITIKLQKIWDCQQVIRKMLSQKDVDNGTLHDFLRIVKVLEAEIKIIGDIIINLRKEFGEGNNKENPELSTEWYIDPNNKEVIDKFNVKFFEFMQKEIEIEFKTISEKHMGQFHLTGDELRAIDFIENNQE
jgi:hypothetical protein